VVTIGWIERVRSTAYQTPNTMPRIAAKIGVLVVSGAPRSARVREVLCDVAGRQPSSAAGWR